MKIRFVGSHECHEVSGVAVVVDVLRAFSFAAFALAAGADRLILMDDLEEALALARSIPGALAGKDGVPQDGFDLFNSPGQLLERNDLGGRTIVHRTGAGTIGAVAARHVQHLFCASLVVARATVDRVTALDPDEVTFVITGAGGQADDDLACAEYIAAGLTGRAVAPDAYIRRIQVAGEGLREGVARGFKGVHADDVDLCCDIDRFDFALRAREEEGVLVLRKG